MNVVLAPIDWMYRTASTVTTSEFRNLVRELDAEGERARSGEKGRNRRPNKSADEDVAALVRELSSPEGKENRNSAVLTQERVERALRHVQGVRPDMIESIAAELIRRADANEDGVVDETEFLELMAEERRAVWHDCCRERGELGWSGWMRVVCCRYVLCCKCLRSCPFAERSVECQARLFAFTVHRVGKLLRPLFPLFRDLAVSLYAFLTSLFLFFAQTIQSFPQAVPWLRALVEVIAGSLLAIAVFLTILGSGSFIASILGAMAVLFLMYAIPTAPISFTVE